MTVLITFLVILGVVIYPFIGMGIVAFCARKWKYDRLFGFMRWHSEYRSGRAARAFWTMALWPAFLALCAVCAIFYYPAVLYKTAFQKAYDG